MVSPVTRLVAGRSLSALATAIIPTTLTLAVLRSSGGDAELGLVLACELVPMLVFLPVGGVVADRFRPARVVLAADLGRAAAQAALGAELLLGGARLPVIAALAALTGLAVAFGTPAVAPLVAAAVEGPRRLRVNARIGVATGLSAVMAPAIAGGVVLAAGPGWACLLTAAVFACSAATLGGVRTAPRAGAGRTGLGRGLAEGWGEVRRRPWFLASVLGHGVWHFTAGLFLTLGPLIAVRRLGGEGAWVLIVQCGSAGLLAGVLVAPRLPVRRPLVPIAAGAAAFCLPLAALAVPVPAPALAAAYFAAMFGLGLLTPLWETLIAARVPEAALGRVRSFDSLISFAARPLGFAVAAPLAGWAGATAPLAISAVAVAAASLAVLAVPGAVADTTPPAPVPARAPVGESTL
ncbi:MFS transporter [Bailinhaonella thermotolerans]|uniref:MFS transporter n=1 Tax=Bailinhaonella thermotolerans TaxID=1070861 RepID=A0A3A4B753_9ACTN|nr:MFS transporter [Bailinhaonella thermotolerans]RJL34051.1 MFS transporter [Bailinhaonella thermotolerans]